MTKQETIQKNIETGWAIIDGYPFHRVLIDGRVQTMFKGGKLSKDWIDMSPDTDRREGKGYKRVCVIYNKKHRRQSVHRLVAEYFVSNNENKPQVNHINGIKDDNRYENLEWVTARENIVHAVNNGLNPGVRGADQGQSKLTEAAILEIKDLLGRGLTQSKIAEKFNIHQVTISKIHTGKLWRHVA